MATCEDSDTTEQVDKMIWTYDMGEFHEPMSPIRHRKIYLETIKEIEKIEIVYQQYISQCIVKVWYL